MVDRDSLMAFAVETVQAAGAVTLRHFGTAAVDFKADGSEITAADTSAEELIRHAVAERFPDHGVFGEEGSRIAAKGRYRWIVDPIDGTRSFASAVPLYAILLALEEDGEAVLGCCHFPVAGDTVVAARGAGCWWGERRAEVSKCERLEEARLVTSGLEYWRDWATEEGRSGFDRLVRGARFARTWGDAFGYVLVATGRAEMLADPACGARWDLAPMLPILAEAGGEFTTLGGGAVKPWSSALASNGRLHAVATRCWRGAADDRLQTDAVRRRGEG